MSSARVDPMMMSGASFSIMALQKSIHRFRDEVGIPVGEVDQFDAVFAVKSGEFGVHFSGVAVTSVRPESSLPAIIAEMWTVSWELNDDGPLAFPI